MPNPTRGRTLDRGPPEAQRHPHYVVGTIGPKRKMRPDGTLLCEDVPVARTGTMPYHPSELPMLRPPTRPGANLIYVTRDEETLFGPSSLGSLAGCAVTMMHPAVDVTPQNRAHLAVGFVLDAWRGTGDASDLMFADLVITDPGAIHKVCAEGLREVSLGYGADYVQTGDGEARQRNIVINHLALVDRGRCGPRCAIGDRLPEREHMPRPNEGGGQTRRRVRLEEATETLRNTLEALEDGGHEDDDGVHVHVHMGAGDADPGGGDGGGRGRTADVDELSERVGDIEQGMLQMNSTLETILAAVQGGNGGAGGGAPPGGGGGAPTGDSGALAASWQTLLSQAEILVPGFKPASTFDAALPRARTVDLMCGCRRQVLQALASTQDGRALVDQVADEGFDPAGADCTAVAVVFKGAAALRGAGNNRAATGDRMGVPLVPAGQIAARGGRPFVPTEEQINKAHAEHWAKQA